MWPRIRETMEANKHGESVQRLIVGEKLQGSPLSQRLTSEEHPKGDIGDEGFIALETGSIARDDDDVGVGPDELVSSRSELNNDEIMKELKRVRRQNVVTHCLLTAILVLTLVGEISEIALISRVKSGLNNPVKALGGLLQGLIKRPITDQNKVEADRSHSLPKVKVELPHVPIPDLSGRAD